MTESKTDDYLEARTKAARVRSRKITSVVEIEQGVPIPVETRGGVHVANFDHFYPFEDMKVGDSFWVADGLAAVRPATTKFAAKSGWKFLTRAQSREGKKAMNTPHSKRGVRVWRTG